MYVYFQTETFKPRIKKTTWKTFSYSVKAESFETCQPAVTWNNLRPAWGLHKIRMQVSSGIIRHQSVFAFRDELQQHLDLETTHTTLYKKGWSNSQITTWHNWVDQNFFCSLSLPLLLPSLLPLALLSCHTNFLSFPFILPTFVLSILPFLPPFFSIFSSNPPLAHCTYTV